MSKSPWEDPISPWDNEADFLNWLRGEIRRVWTHHPTKNEYVNQRRFKAPIGRVTKNNPKGQMVWAVECENCGVHVKTSKPKGQRTSEFNVDHLVGGEGFKDEEGLFRWMKRMLFITSDDIRILCTPCHKVVNHMQKTGYSFTEAKADKKAIAICGKGCPEKQWLLDRGVEPAKGSKERRRQVREYLLQEKYSE